MSDDPTGAGEEAIEDLEAPANMQADVSGGMVDCISPTCLNNSAVRTWCLDGTCNATASECKNATGYVIIKEQ